ncbi:MAG: nucleoside triphosphate pyrophosphohydrolase [Bdellovibrionales bacterium RIFOXYD1_FULL_44_7]|nr:MAG: nucleoside triphosphate pyrophosphohydrolase [Bdellovibrionales bacterium RIFOXYD1_FULL_44_7]
MNKTDVLLQLIETVHRLRAPDGCPWDRVQTHQTLRQYLIEEAYEVLDVLDKIRTNEDLKDEEIKLSFKEELGDLLMQVLLHSEMTKQEGAFDIYDVAQGLNDKLVRRHPHVFGENKASTADGALKRWEEQKAKEKAENPKASILDGVPNALPALQKAARIVEKATKVGFQWKDLQGPIEKVEEELTELKVELNKPNNERDISKISHELGDVLFSICNLAYLVKVTPEDALRSTIARFETRFRYVEQKLKKNGKSPDQSSLEEMDVFWNEAKLVERGQNK